MRVTFPWLHPLLTRLVIVTSWVFRSLRHSKLGLLHDTVVFYVLLISVVVVIYKLFFGIIWRSLLVRVLTNTFATSATNGDKLGITI